MSNQLSHSICFKGIFMRHLLKFGYHLQDWDKIEFVKRVSHAEVGWTLGYTLLNAANWTELRRPQPLTRRYCSRGSRSS